MPGKRTAKVQILLNSFGNPKLTLLNVDEMARNNERLAAMHHKLGSEETSTVLRAWHFSLRNNALKRREKWLSKER